MKFIATIERKGIRFDMEFDAQSREEVIRPLIKEMNKHDQTDGQKTRLISLRESLERVVLDLPD
jgi:DNA-binding winged helix-turn-helix (wHTH) protein